jgi:ribosomal protein S18 acetylase RimI-like enzyme
MIRDIRQEDKRVFLEMTKKFYSSKAVAHNLDNHILETTFDTAVSKSPFIRALIIEDNETPVGFAVLTFSYATEVGGTVVLLEDLYVSETCRGKGVGSKFMQFMEHEYSSAKRFRLEVKKENKKAIELYCKLGYKILDYVQMIKDI